MTPWIALTLGLWLGQTPYSTEPATPQPAPMGSYGTDEGYGGSSTPPDFSTRGVGGENVTDSDNPTFSTDQGVGSTNTGATEYGGPGSVSAGTGAGIDTRTSGTPSGTGTEMPGAPPYGATSTNETGTGGAGAAGTGTTPETGAGAAGTGTPTETGAGAEGTGTPTETETGTTGVTPQGAVLQPPAGKMTPQQMANQIQQLQTQVQTLQQQLQQSDQQLQQTTERAQTLQQNFGIVQSGAQQLEQLRQQRLQDIQRAWQWLVAADNALELGQLDVSESLSEADRALGSALQNSSRSGKGDTEVLMQMSRDLIAEAQAELNNRNTPLARYNLQSAGWNLYQARILAQTRPDVSLVTPPPQTSTPSGR